MDSEHLLIQLTDIAERLQAAKTKVDWLKEQNVLLRAENDRLANELRVARR